MFSLEGLILKFCFPEGQYRILLNENSVEHFEEGLPSGALALQLTWDHQSRGSSYVHIVLGREVWPT